MISAPFSFNIGQVLEKYQKDRAWRKAARAYYLYRFGKMTQEQIGRDPHIKDTQGHVSDKVSKMRGELSRLAGQHYEAWKAEQLRKRGYEVKADGKVGKPSLVAKSEQTGEVRVYSSKCLEFTRKIMLPIKEIRPELHVALGLKAKLVLSV